MNRADERKGEREEMVWDEEKGEYVWTYYNDDRNGNW